MAVLLGGPAKIRLNEVQARVLRLGLLVLIVPRLTDLFTANATCLAVTRCANPMLPSMSMPTTKAVPPNLINDPPDSSASYRETDATDFGNRSATRIAILSVKVETLAVAYASFDNPVV